jgi:hypothetical protein
MDVKRAFLIEGPFYYNCFTLSDWQDILRCFTASDYNQDLEFLHSQFADAGIAGVLSEDQSISFEQAWVFFNF